MTLLAPVPPVLQPPDRPIVLALGLVGPDRTLRRAGFRAAVHETLDLLLCKQRISILLICVRAWDSDAPIGLSSHNFLPHWHDWLLLPIEATLQLANGLTIKPTWATLVAQPPKQKCG